MVSVFNQPLDFTDRGENVQHFSRQAEVIFVKKVRILPEPGFAAPSQADQFHLKYAEFIGNILIENKALEARDSASAGSAVYEYWQVTTSSVGAVSDVSGTATLIPNADVVEISVRQTVRGMSSATIVVKNAQNKYVFQNSPRYVGQPLFTSDDLVYVNLPGLDNNLYRTFTGLITTVSVSAQAGGTYINQITIECDDMLKRLRENRVASRPSFFPAESKGTLLSPWQISYADKLPHEILTQIFARAYCDFYTHPDFASELTTIRQGASTDPNGAAVKEEDLYSLLSHVPIGNNTAFQSNASPLLDSSSFIVTSGTITTTVPVLSSDQLAPAGVANTSLANPTLQVVPTSLPRQIFGFTNARPPLRSLQGVNSVGAAASTIDKTMAADTLTFLIEGTAQPTWTISFANPSISNFTISEWQSALEIVEKIAQETEFELFTTPEGIVRFRPFNALLPADVTSGQTTPNVPQDQFPRVGYEYWLQQQYIISDSYRDTDRDVFTIAYVLGAYQFANLNSAPGVTIFPGIATDPVRYAQLGARTAPQKIKISLVTTAACQAYAVAYLNRLNARARSGSVEYIGDARLRAGNPCYIPYRNRIFYIESLTHHYVAGKSYRTSLSLTYGRIPFALTLQKAQQISLTIGNPVTIKNLLTYDVFEAVLGQLQASLVLSANPIYSGGALDNNTLSEVDRYLKYGPNEDVVAGDGQLVFQGYVWEDIPVMTYEDIVTDTSISGPSIDLAQIVLDANLNSRVFLENVQAYMRSHPAATPPQAAVGAVSASISQTPGTGTAATAGNN